MVDRYAQKTRHRQSDGNIVNLADAFDPEYKSIFAGKVEPFGQQGIYELTNVFAFSNFLSFSTLNDHEATATNSASKTVSDGLLDISTGTTSNSTYRYETKRFGVYQAGKAVESGIAAFLQQKITDDSSFKIGLGDGSNGAFYEVKSDVNRVVVLRKGSREAEIDQKNWNHDTLDGSGGDSNPSGHKFDPTNIGYIFGIRFSWYSVGSISFVVWFAESDTFRQMTEVTVHKFVPDGITSFVDPRQPLFAEIDNGTTTTDFKAQIGGRRYDIMGEYRPETRNSGDKREKQTVGSNNDKIPLISVKPKNEFPSGKNNNATAFLDEFYVITNQNLVLAIYFVDEGDLTNASFSDPTDIDTSETALQYDTSATAITNVLRATPHILIEAGGNRNNFNFTSEKGRRIPILRDKVTVLAADNLTGTDATVTSSIGVLEMW